jgi:4-aminobutyrate aminotransferase
MSEDPANLDALRSEGDVNLGRARAQWAAKNIDEETGKWLAEDAEHFIHQSLSTPCLDVLVGVAGTQLETLSGHRLLDFHGNAVHQVGYGHPVVIDAIKRQLDTLPFCPRRYTNLPAICLAKKLVELAPGDLRKVLFAPGGTSAIGIALKLARAATGKFKTLSMWESFHGSSLDALSIGGEAVFRKGAGPLLPGTEHVPPPDPLQSPWPETPDPDGWAMRSAEYLEYVLEREAGDIGAVIAETVRWTPYVPPAEYWQFVRAACDKHGALLILDEIPTCLGRSGKMFVCEHYGIVPDILVIGKGLGGGVVPLAAVIAREGLELAPEGALGHYTHEKNPMACAAGLATIKVIEEEGLLAHVSELGGESIEMLNRLQEDHSHLVSEVRGIGLLLGLILTRPDGSKAVEAAEQVMYRAMEKGLSFKLTMGSSLTLTPPLTITREEMIRAVEILDTCLRELGGENKVKRA